MEKQTNSRNFLGALIPVIGMIVVIFYLLPSSCSILGGGSAKSAAEKYVRQKVYTTISVVPERMSSDVIYKTGNKRLIEVKYGLTSGGWDGKCCVYTSADTAINATSVMGIGYDFRGSIEELKALFGI